MSSSVSKLDIKERIKLFEDYEASGQGWFWATDGQGRISYITEGVADELGVSSEAIVGQPLASIFVLERDDSEEGVERPLGFLLSARNTISDMTVRAASDEKELWWLISGKPKFDANGEFLGYRGHGKDITARRHKEHDASRLAMYDSLTGLANRHRMSRQLGATLTAYRASRRSCALMMLDLDRFKHVNDTLGHPAGDELLMPLTALGPGTASIHPTALDLSKISTPCFIQTKVAMG